MSKIELARSARGSFAQNEDWVYLVTREDGSRYVLHEWDRLNSGSGMSEFSVESLLGANHSSSLMSDAAKKLREIIET